MQDFDPAARRSDGRPAKGTTTANGSLPPHDPPGDRASTPRSGSALGPAPESVEGPDALPGYDAVLDEHDTPAEVDAAFRTQRRVAVGYAILFALVTLAVPTLGLGVEWWSTGRLLGGLSPSFAMVSVGLYVVFFVLAVASAMLAGSVEDRMLGGPDRSLFEREEDGEEEDAH